LKGGRGVCFFSKKNILILNVAEKNIMILLDFPKAFDTVPHDKLMYKLEKYGIKGDLHKWLTSFLTKREMRVIREGEQ
jgi:hypothetical protein